MLFIDIKSLSEDPRVLTDASSKNESVLIMNHNQPVSLAVPLNDTLLDSGLTCNLAVRLYEQGIVTLTKAANISGHSVEAFLPYLKASAISVIDFNEDDLISDLDNLDG